MKKNRLFTFLFILTVTSLSFAYSNNFPTVKCKSGNLLEVVSSLESGKTYNLKVTASINNETIKNISSALKQDKSVKLYIDLSETEGLKDFKGLSNHENLLGITFPKDTGIIKAGTFKNCMNLEYIKFHPENKSFKMIDNALYTSNGTKLILVMPQAKIVKISDGVKGDISAQISERKFLEYLELPGTISKVKIESDLKNLKVLKIRSCDTENKTFISYTARKIPNLEEVYLGNTVIKIDNSFEECSKLKKVIFDDGLISIEHSFRFCPELTEVNIGKNVKNIGYSFNNCEKLSKIDLGESLEYIRTSFNSCPLIERIVFPPALKTIGAYSYEEEGKIFDMCDFEEICFGENLGALYSGIGKSIKDLYLPESLKVIHLNKFYDIKIDRVHKTPETEYIFLCKYGNTYGGENNFIIPPYSITDIDCKVTVDKDSLISKEELFASPESFGKFFTCHTDKYYILINKSDLRIEEESDGKIRVYSGDDFRLDFSEGYWF